MRKKILDLVIISVLSVYFLTGCKGGAKKEILATVDGKYEITLTEFNQRIEKLPERYQEVINKNKPEFLNELVINVLLYNEALKKGLEKDKEVKDVLEEAKKKILISKLLQEEVEGKVNVSQDEIREYYDKNRDKFTTPEVLRASHILVKSEKDANDILVQLSNGRNFEEIAKARSIDAAAASGGDIGYFTKGQLPPEIENACFTMETGEISGVVATKFGYHIIKLTERRLPEAKPLSDVEDVIRQTIARSKKQVKFDSFVERLKEKSKITINNTLLDEIAAIDEPTALPRRS